MIDFLNNPYFILAVGIVSIINVLLLIWLFLRLCDFGMQHSQLVAGEEVPSIEEIVLKHKKTLATHNKNLKELGKILEELVENNKLNIQRAGVVRFNLFAETGGNMSFAIALLDGKNNGIVISSLHGREGTRVYAKSVAGGKSQSRLTEEEEQAIKQANNL